MRNLLLALVYVLILPVPAQETATTLDTLRTGYDVKMSELEVPMAEWHQKYVAQLQVLQAKAQQAGDLEQMLVIKQEIEGANPEIDAKYATLKRMRGIYDQRSASIEQAIAGKRRQVMAEYHRQLSALQAHLTKSGAIDQALKVRDEIAEVEIQAKAHTGTVRRPRTRQPGSNTRPGRLVVYGVHGESGERITLPESATGKPFVRVFASHNIYYAVDPNGAVLAMPDLKRDHALPDEEMKPVSDISVGSYVAIMLNDDGSLTRTQSGWNKGLIPEGEDFLKVVCGYVTNGALKKNGEVLAFGYGLKKKTFIHPEMLQGVKDIAISGDIFIFNRRDGKVQATHYSEDHEWRNKPKGLDGHVVAMAGGTNPSCVFLLDDGTVKGWQAGDVPEDLEGVRQVRAGHRVYAAQKPDGTWVCWGSGEAVSDLNQQLERLGPLKDLALGHKFFIGVK